MISASTAKLAAAPRYKRLLRSDIQTCSQNGSHARLYVLGLRSVGRVLSGGSSEDSAGASDVVARRFFGQRWIRIRRARQRLSRQGLCCVEAASSPGSKACRGVASMIPNAGRVRGCTMALAAEGGKV